MKKMIQIGTGYGEHYLLPIECLPFLAGVERLEWKYNGNNDRSFLSLDPVDFVFVDADGYPRGDPDKTVAPDPVVAAPVPVTSVTPDHQAQTTGSPFVPSNEVLSIKPSDLPAMRDFVEEWR